MKTMHDKTATGGQPDEPGKESGESEKPHRHNPFEDKKDSLTKEEEEAMEEFKEAQTERD